jgi:hypothetical protein
MLRLVFGQALRQTEGLMRSIFQLFEIDLKAPDHTTLSRRSITLKALRRQCALPAGPLYLLIDSTGPKLFGAGEWLQEKYGQKSRRSWRKLHLAVDASTGHIEASVLTDQDVDDPSQLGPLLDQIEHEVTAVTADGTDDGEPSYGRIAQPDTQIDVVIALRVTAQPSAQFEAAPTIRDKHLLMIQYLGRLDWQRPMATANVRWWKPRCVASRPSSGRACVPVIHVATRPKQMLRWRCSTAC